MDDECDEVRWMRRVLRSGGLGGCWGPVDEEGDEEGDKVRWMRRVMRSGG